MNDLLALPGDIIRNALVELIERKLNTTTFSLKLEPGSKKGENFVGIVYRVSFSSVIKSDKVELSNDSGNMKVKINESLFVKISPQNIAQRGKFFSQPLFLREIHMYEKVLPFIRKFQESKEIAKESSFCEYAKCYKTIDTQPFECLFFEDLKEEDFEMVDCRSEAITVEHARLVMNALGKLHAVSFALKDQQSQQFRVLTDDLSDVLFNESNPLYACKYSRIINGLSEFNDGPLLQKMNQLHVRHQMIIPIAVECVSSALAEPYAVICHGDCWTNNTMFKYNTNGVPIDVRFVDWQMSRYASPVTDIVYYLFSCTSKELRDQYYEDLLRTYHNSLSRLLKSLGSDSSKLYTYEAMQKQLLKFGKFGLSAATMIVPIITTNFDDCPSLDEIAAQCQSGMRTDKSMHVSKESKDQSSKRYRDITADLVRLGYI